METVEDVKGRLRLWAGASVAVIAAAYALASFRAGAGSVPAWHALVMVVPHLFIIVLARSGRSGDLLLGYTRGVVAATRAGILISLLLLMLAAFFANDLPKSLHILDPLILVAAEVIKRLSLAGAVVLFAALFLIQFPLGRAATDVEPEGASNGALYGSFTLLLPLVLAISAHRTIVTEARAAEELESARADSVATPVQVVDSRKDLTTEQHARGAVTALHRCAASGCMDSLVAAARAAGVTVAYIPLPKSRYWGLVATDATWEGRRYVTDESGILLRWLPEADRPHLVRPDARSFLAIADSSVGLVVKMAECVDRYYADRKLALPSTLGTAVCGLSSSLTSMTFGGAEYTIAYLPEQVPANTPISRFWLSARPTSYGAPALRSILVDPRGGVHATMADREAAVTDPQLHRCEQRGERCMLATPSASPPKRRKSQPTRRSRRNAAHVSRDDAPSV